MSGRLTYFEHVAGQRPELEVVEFTNEPNAEAMALRTVLVRVTAERDYWRDQYQRLSRDITATARRNAAGEDTNTGVRFG